MAPPDAPVPRAWRAVVAGGALLFTLSLGYFLYTYAFTFRETLQTGSAAAAIGWDVGLFTIFGLHHSVFARQRVRRWMAQTVPAPLERSAYVWVASLLLMAVCTLWRPVGGVAWRLNPVPGGVLMAAGAWLTIRSAAAIDIWELAGVKQVGTTPSQPAVEFKTTGPYGFVRHPIYLGWFLIVFGVPVMTGTRLVFAVASCVYLLIAIPLEERTLRRTSDGKYDRYMQAVRWKLVPGIF